ncbi:MAG TPA: zinc-dependent metalloprotease, partial [Chitinophagaceae bacterium]|nr:zinc-dependent metalloprotease [Chitinophagaceae bacterium]
VFSTGGGGIASLACICATNKAQGVTGSSNPVGDPFDIDYVAHEMGHQFGGSHTFNSVTGSCSGNRSSNSAYEIGSATTIMGYAGICGTDNIQPHSDDYYHVRSLEQMTGSSVKTCAAITMTGNTPPVLTSINKTYIIPYKTPFELTATATDANNDPLTYCWEQYNRGGSGSAWNAKTTVAPILRSFNPDTSGTRVFPKYSELIKNTESYLGEILPDTARILRFRCTVRDMHLGNGAFYTSVDTTKLDVRQTASLFRVTSQNTTGQSWTGYESKTITWNVAGTDIAPVAANNVNIYLSIDSGKTWPFILASNTSNDGSESIVVPNFASDWARVKVKGAGNVFFDLNDEWIQIKKVVSPSGIENYNESLISIYPNPSQGEFDIHLSLNKEIGKIEIVNSVGQIVYEDIIGSNKTHLNTNLSQGVYFVKIQVDNKQIVKKIIIN